MLATDAHWSKVKKEPFFHAFHVQFVHVLFTAVAKLDGSNGLVLNCRNVTPPPSTFPTQD